MGCLGCMFAAHDWERGARQVVEQEVGVLSKGQLTRLCMQNSKLLLDYYGMIGPYGT